MFKPYPAFLNPGLQLRQLRFLLHQKDAVYIIIFNVSLDTFPNIGNWFLWVLSYVLIDCIRYRSRLFDPRCLRQLGHFLHCACSKKGGHSYLFVSCRSIDLA